jgi:O-antigen ligase
VIFSPAFYTVFSLPKITVLHLLTLAVMLLWGYKIFLEKRVEIVKSPINFALLGFAFAGILSTIFSFSFYTSWYGTEGHFTGIITVLNLLLLTFIVLNWIRSREEVITLLKVSFITSVILAVYGILQYFNIFQDSFNWSQNPSDRVFGTLGHSNHFGAYLAMNLLLGLGLFSVIKKISHKYILSAGIILVFITLMLTVSRGAIFALLIGLIYLLVTVLKRKLASITGFIRKKLTLFILGLLLLICLAALPISGIVRLPIIERTVQTIEFINQGYIPDRLSWWISSLEMIRDKPLLGFGLSTFRDVYNLYRRTDYLTPGPGNLQDYTTPEAAHNEYLNLAATQGLLGLLGFIVLLYFAFRPQKKELKSAKIDWLHLGVKSAIIVYLVQVIFNFGVIGTTGILYILLGVSAVLIAQKTTEEKSICKISLHTYAKYVFLFVLFSLISLGGIWTWREAAAEYYYKNAVTAQARGNLEGAIINFQSAVNTRPYEYSYYQAFGDFALKNSGNESLSADTKMKFLNLALIKYRRAVEINSNHPSTFFNLGMAEMQAFKASGDTNYLAAAEADFSKAVILAVNNPLYAYQIGKAYLGCDLALCKVRAKKYLQKAVEIRPKYEDAQTLIK